MKGGERGGQIFDQVFGDEAGSDPPRRVAVQPDGGRRRDEGRHALRQEAEDQAGEHIAGAGGRQFRRRAGVDRGAPIWRGDDRIAALQHDHGAARPRGAAGPLELAAAGVEKPGKFAIMWGHDAIVVDRGEQVFRVPGKYGQRIGVENGALSG